MIPTEPACPGDTAGLTILEKPHFPLGEQVLPLKSNDRL